MKIIVIGAVAAGTSAAAKARRNDPTAEIIVYEKAEAISYAACGLPYYIGDIIKDIDALSPRDVESFKEKKGVIIKTSHEVINISAREKTVKVKDLKTKITFDDQYDKLIIATGAKSFIPPVEGANQSHVFSLRTLEDGIKIKRFIKDKNPKNIIIAGSGFIGLELLENLNTTDNSVTIVELMDQLTPNLDADMANYLMERFNERGLGAMISTKITKILKHSVIVNDETSLKADMVIMATGIKPNTKIAKKAGITTGIKNAIVVDDTMQTNVKDVYACGDCIETFSSITKQPNYHPLGTTANKTGRIAGDVVTGGALRYRGNLGTGIFKLFDLTIATTGLSEKTAIETGYKVISKTLKTKDKPSYFDGEVMLIKAVVDNTNNRLLGVQIIGGKGVDKRIDIFATLITYHATMDDLFHLDLAYAPPFAPVKDPVHYMGMIF